MIALKNYLNGCLLTCLCALAIFPNAMATHLVGGNLGYEYVGETAPGSGVYRYRVFMQFYLNCDGTSNFETLYELLNQNYGTPLPVGVYVQDQNNPNADKTQFTVSQLLLVDSTLIEPDLPNNCVVGQGLCTKEGLFETFVDLPLNFGGYHLYYQMCCRNLAIDNIANPNGTGIGYYAYIPPPLVNNSSPVFLGLPTPFLCTSDTTTFLNSAFDPDGDQLIFSFETPYDSYVGGGGIQQPPNPLGWPIPTVGYNGGYSTAQPFGAGGYSFINGATGLTEYVSPNQGNFVVAVEVKEFRNGILIGRTRRDLQLQVVVCPPNATPQLSSSQQFQYSVDAGDLLCFDMEFDDLDGDSLFLDAAGAIFDINLFNPPATINAPDSGLAFVDAQFCWDTGCDQGQSQPYVFSVSVTDNGCPPKTIDVVYEVTVVPFAGPQQINGPDAVCQGDSLIAYSTDSIAGATYQWSVTGGSLTGPFTGPSAVVDWGTSTSGTVSVMAFADNGCPSDTISLPVTINPIPSANAGADVSICVGTSTAIGGSPTGPPGSVYTWSPAGDLSNPSAANPVADPIVTTSFIVSVSTLGCIATDTVVVNVQSVQADAGNDVAICIGDTAQLSATGGTSYQWSPPQGLSNANVADPDAFPSTTTTYIVNVSDLLGCAASDTVIVNVNPLPAVDAGADTTVCPGQPVTIGGDPTGPAGSTFSWDNSVSLDNASLANPIATPLVTTTYTVTVADTNSCNNNDQITVTLLPAPAVSAGPDLSICPGDSIQLQGSGAGTLSWSPGASLSDTTIADPWATPSITTTYSLTVTDGSQCSSTDQVTVTVLPLPNADAGTTTPICSGDTLQLLATGGDLYVWLPIATLSDPNIADPLAYPTSTTTYLVLVTDTFGCSAADSVLIIVNDPPDAGADGAAIVCSSDGPVDLFSLLGGAPQQGGIWDPVDTYIPGGGGGTFTYVATGVPPCPTDTSFVLISEVEAPDAGQSTAVPICADGNPIDLFSALGGTPDSSGIWLDPNGNPFGGNFDPLTHSPGDYIYIVDGTGPCSNDTAIVAVSIDVLPNVDAGVDVSVCIGSAVMIGGSPTGPAGSSYNWTPFGGLDNIGAANPNASPDSTTVYTVLVTDGNGCSSIDSVTVFVNSLPFLDAGPDTSVCLGSGVQLNAMGSGPFVWDPVTGLNDPNIADPIASPTASTTYTVTTTDANNCTSVDVIEVTVLQLPTADAGEDVWVCPGFDVQLAASGGVGYTWDPPTGLSDPNIPDPLAGPAQTTIYTVTVTDLQGCSATDDVEVTVNDDVPINAGQDQSICLGDTVVLGGNPTSVNGSTFSWSPSAGLSDTADANPFAYPSGTITYLLTVTNDTCTNTDMVTVTIQGEADAGFIVRFEPGCEGTRAYFTNQSLNAISYFWEFGDGTTSTEDDPIHLFIYGQDITVSLTATDVFGCSSTEVQNYPLGSYEDEVDIFVPNVFTPNGDGNNDVFSLASNAFLGPCTEFHVFNRWGQLVFTSQGNNITWDGRTIAGEPAVPGTYFYTIVVQAMEFKGSLTLNR